MIMSARTKEILQILTAEKHYITIKEIASELSISERTVYREIPEVANVLAVYGMELQTASKKGMRIMGKEEQIQKLLQELGGKKYVQVVDPKERLYLIILELLHEIDYIKTEALAIDLRTSLPTVRNDLKKIKKAVEEYNLQLIQKKGEGILLQGTQASKDHLLIYSLLENVEIPDLYLWLDGNLEKSNPFLEKMEEYGYKEYFIRLHQMFSKEGDFLEIKGLYLEDLGYLEMVFLAALLVKRNRDGIKDESEEFRTLETNKNEKEISEELREKIQEEFHIHLGKSERQYLLWLVHICVASKSKQSIIKTNSQMKESVLAFVRRVEEEMGIYLCQDQKLMDGLIVHLDKALKRTRSGMSISNPIIREIEKDYQELFSIVKASVREVFPEDYFPDDEIGYLVLYFAVSLDNITKKTFRILVVCSSGMGSSKMLASRLEREIPEIYVRKIVSLIGLGKEDLNEYDLILSTVPLYLNSNEYLKVSPLLNPQELELVKEKIRRHKHRTLKRIGSREKRERQWEKNGVAALSQLKEFTNYATQLLEDFRVLNLDSSMDLGMIYKEISRWAQKIDLNIDEEELMRYYQNKKVMECYFVIPSTKVSYFECFLEKIRKPALMICHFGREEKRDWQTGETIKAMVALFYPKQLDFLKREFVGTITDMIIDDANIIQMMEQGDEEGIKNCLSFRFLEYIRRIV